MKHWKHKSAEDGLAGASGGHGRRAVRGELGLFLGYGVARIGPCCHRLAQERACIIRWGNLMQSQNVLRQIKPRVGCGWGKGRVSGLVGSPPIDASPRLRAEAYYSYYISRTSRVL